MKQRYLLFRYLVAASGESALRLLKNCIKVLIGRKPYFNEPGLFLWQYLLHLAGIRPIRKITCTGLPSEGAGSQALLIMNAINLSRALGLSYVHTPFSNIRYPNRPMQDWVAAWESVFNLGAGEVVCGADRHDAVNYCYNFSHLDLCLGLRGREDELALNYKALIPEFRRKYYLNKSSRTTDELTVAVHIRRGHGAGPDRLDYYTKSEKILQTITSVRSILEAYDVKYQMRVYSQGDRSEFSDFFLPGVELFLDVDAVWTMQELVEADVLIMAKGCYSYYAGLISDGVKIYEPFSTTIDDLAGWRWVSVSPMESWIPCAEDGNFDTAGFERQLFHVMRAKAGALTPINLGQKSKGLV